MRRANELYIGSTTNLRKRLLEHNKGSVPSTRRYIPWKLAYYEAFSEEGLARARESRLKNNGNAMLELKKRIGIQVPKEGSPLTTFPRESGKGFTMIEVLMVMGILSVLASVVLFVDINSYRGDAFRAEVSALGVALQTARANALNNINENRHGVSIHQGGCDGYLIFDGDSAATANHALDICIAESYEVSFSPSSPTEVVFDRLSGNAITAAAQPYDGDITLVDPNRNITATISINHEGRISW